MLRAGAKVLMALAGDAITNVNFLTLKHSLRGSKKQLQKYLVHSQNELAK
jgi:hypothetical protein